MNVDHDIQLLVKHVKRLGQADAAGVVKVVFKTLVMDEEASNELEALNGTLRAAKKRGIIDFPGQMLLQGKDDAVEITLKAPPITHQYMARFLSTVATALRIRPSSHVSLQEAIKHSVDSHKHAFMGQVKAAIVAAPISYPNPSQLLDVPKILRNQLAPFQDPTCKAPIPIVGAVVSSIPDSDPISVLLLHGPDVSVDAVFSLSPPPKSKRKAVGRWPDLSLPDGSSDLFSTKSGGFDVAKFKGLQETKAKLPLKELDGVVATERSLTVLFADKDSQEFLAQLDEKLPASSKIGMIGAMTPFATGAPYTLFHNDDFLTGGVSGLQISFKSLAPTVEVQWDGLVAMGETQKITRSRGNVVLAVENGSAAKQLVQQVQMVPSEELSSDHRLYAKVQSEDNVGDRIYRITSGDPSSGILSLDTSRNIEPGMTITFLRPQKGSDSITDAGRKNHLEFFTQDSETFHASSNSRSSEFCAGSDGGIIWGKANAPSDMTDYKGKGMESSPQPRRVIVASLFLPHTVSVTVSSQSPAYEFKQSLGVAPLGGSADDGFFPSHIKSNTSTASRRRRPSEVRMGVDEPMYWTIEPSGHGNIGLQNAVESMALNGHKPTGRHASSSSSSSSSSSTSTASSSSEAQGKSKVAINRIFVGCLGGVSTDPWHESMKTEVARCLLEKSCIPVYISDEEADGHYNQFCKQVLWKPFHYQLPDYPKPQAYEELAWRQYVAVNQKFANAIVENHRPTDIGIMNLTFGTGLNFFLTVWVNDYHLMLVPSMVRQQIPDATIGFFLHIPFPIRKQILQGLLGADLVGFQTYSFMRHFLMTCTRLLALESTPKGIQMDNTVVAVGIFPIGLLSDICFDADGHQGINLDALNEKRNNPEVPEMVAALSEKYAGKKVVIGRDKNDYVKGVRQKMLAFERFLKEHPEWHGKVVLIQVALSTTEANENECHVSDVVGRINSKYGTIEYSPVVYLQQDISFSHYLALLTIADACLITSLRDGMNLTSHEYVVCQEVKKSPLIISEFAGTYGSFGAALRVNPWDTREVADAIYEALSMSDDDKSTRWTELYRYVSTHTAQNFVETFVNELPKIHDESQQVEVSHIPLLPFPLVLSDYENSQKRVFFLDIEGTMCPARSSTVDRTKYFAGLVQLVSSLASSRKNLVYLMSGCTREELNSFIGLPNVGLCAENGSFFMYANKSRWETTLTDQDLSWRKQVMEIFEFYADRTPGSYIEQKEISIVWHYELADLNFGSWQAAECQNHIQNALGTTYPISTLVKKKSIEVLPRNVNKGTICKKVLEGLPGGTYNRRFSSTARVIDTGHSLSTSPAIQTPQSSSSHHSRAHSLLLDSTALSSLAMDFVLCIGDDRADEFMFEYLHKIENPFRRDSSVPLPGHADGVSISPITPTANNLPPIESLALSKEPDSIPGQKPTDTNQETSGKGASSGFTVIPRFRMPSSMYMNPTTTAVASDVGNPILGDHSPYIMGSFSEDSEDLDLEDVLSMSPTFSDIEFGLPNTTSSNGHITTVQNNGDSFEDRVKSPLLKITPTVTISPHLSARSPKSPRSPRITTPTSSARTTRGARRNSGSSSRQQLSANPSSNSSMADKFEATTPSKDTDEDTFVDADDGRKGKRKAGQNGESNDNVSPTKSEAHRQKRRRGSNSSSPTSSNNSQDLDKPQRQQTTSSNSSTETKAGDDDQIESKVPLEKGASTASTMDIDSEDDTPLDQKFQNPAKVVSVISESLQGAKSNSAADFFKFLKKSSNSSPLSQNARRSSNESADNSTTVSTPPQSRSSRGRPPMSRNNGTPVLKPGELQSPEEDEDEGLNHLLNDDIQPDDDEEVKVLKTCISSAKKEASELKDDFESVMKRYFGLRSDEISHEEAILKTEGEAGSHPDYFTELEAVRKRNYAKLHVAHERYVQSKRNADAVYEATVHLARDTYFDHVKTIEKDLLEKNCRLSYKIESEITKLNTCHASSKSYPYEPVTIFQKKQENVSYSLLSSTYLPEVADHLPSWTRHVAKRSKKSTGKNLHFPPTCTGLNSFDCSDDLGILRIMQKNAQKSTAALVKDEDVGMTTE
ncbi:hypothetical protein HDU97_008617 [Phlyctochytrium planicorne]|nr:hypothetical protein HDU97_008617 [Phlyctochytrium planicorne]